LKNLEEEKCKLESKLKEELETQRSLNIQVEELTVKVAENAEMMAHHEKMKKQQLIWRSGIWQLWKMNLELKDSKKEVRPKLLKMVPS
jgi:hypothetical protein